MPCFEPETLKPTWKFALPLDFSTISTFQTSGRCCDETLSCTNHSLSWAPLAFWTCKVPSTTFPTFNHLQFQSPKSWVGRLGKGEHFATYGFGFHVLRLLAMLRKFCHFFYCDTYCEVFIRAYIFHSSRFWMVCVSMEWFSRLISWVLIAGTDKQPVWTLVAASARSGILFQSYLCDVLHAL